ncbi:MAG: CHAT domain-containing protein [Candidatus Thiothrix singaporensis]|uniref:CHAT domain-containing protein n=1 Tax=Candidatus Thiothrix singaporensis TaxID=2799669 RepID=A0A7L6AVJ8_9GAMM|nr:MAG: CHAT domain-containing protein [Candidatus Thiothrix singaporensis]
MTLLLLGAKSKHHPLESVPAELSRLKQLFQAAPNTGLAIEYEPYLTRPILTEQLRRLTDRISILHFAGHSGTEQLQTDDELVYAQHIAAILQSWEQKPCLLFLNGCNSGGQANLFLDAGIPCIIATHHYIDDKEAALFAYEFYAGLLADPDKTTLEQAYTRAGALTLMGKNRSPRSLDIDELKQDTPSAWDWGIFTRDRALPTHWTLASLGTSCRQTATPIAAPPDFITKMKLEGLQQRWQRLYQRHAAIQTQYDLEIRAEEKLRMAYILEQNRTDLAQVEQEISELRQ